MPLFLTLSAVTWVLGNLLGEVVRLVARSRVLLVRYEDLRRCPREELLRIGRFLGVNLSGEVRKIAKTVIDAELKQGNIVVLPCIGYSPSGEVFNLSVEDVATQAAIALHADKLITFTQ